MKFEPCLFFVCITGQRWNELKINIEKFYDAVDYLIVIDGNFKEDPTTNEELKKRDKDQKIIWVDFPWCDNFPLSRSKYLETVGMIIKSFDIKNKSIWVCRADDDEYYSDKLIQNLRRICSTADDRGVEMLGIRVHDISLDKEGNELSNSTGDYHKGLVYKWREGLRYIPAGNGSPVHETYNYGFRGIELDNKSGENKDTPYYYEHVKKQGEVWRRAHARNFFIGGGGPNLGDKQPLWQPYRKLVFEVLGKEITDWKEYDDYLVKGDIDRRLKMWFIKHSQEGIEERDLKKYPLSLAEKELGMNYDGASEVREGYKYYFEWLHPKELDRYKIK
jgi:hypothetical protein